MRKGKEPQPFRLRGGQYTNDIRLDRVRKVDLRDLNYLITADKNVGIWTGAPRSRTWRLSAFNDQGSEGACVGFGWGHELAALPAAVPNVNASFSRERIYWEAQKIDEWEGGAYPGATPQYEGTSVRAGAEVVKTLGYISEYRWCMDVREIVYALGYLGPVVIGVDWYTDMFNTDPQGFIHPTGNIEGGHCCLLIGCNIVKLNRLQYASWDNVDQLRSTVTIHNSWGQRWGNNGRAKMSLIEFAKLIPGGDFCIPRGRKTKLA